jgi:hypothetical protein
VEAVTTIILIICRALDGVEFLHSAAPDEDVARARVDELNQARDAGQTYRWERFVAESRIRPLLVKALAIVDEGLFG